MKKIAAYLLFVLVTTRCLAQTSTFDNLNANPLTNKAITWVSSNYGNGFGHRIVNSDPGFYTLLNFQGRNNSATWTNILSLTSQGDIGMGTSNPLSKLHVFNGASNHTPHGFSDLSIEDDEHVMISLLTYNTRSAYYAFADTDDDFVGGIQYDHPNDIMYFRVNNHASDMVINKDGNVGIGTTSPDAKLAVNGNIHTKEVKVDLIGWPDYVFKKGYDLPTLEEVEMHIKEKGHLINIPSAKEVEENGIKLGEMNMKLLEKIEELTLYILKQESKIQKLETMIKKMQND